MVKFPEPKSNARNTSCSAESPLNSNESVSTAEMGKSRHNDGLRAAIGKRTDYSVVAMFRPFSTVYPTRIEHKSAEERNRCLCWHCFHDLATMDTRAKKQLGKVHAHHMPVPLKENCTVSPVVDVSIAVPLRYRDKVGSFKATAVQLPLYFKTGLGASSV